MIEPVEPAVSTILATALARRSSLPPTNVLLIGLSGIDGCGKGYVAGQLTTALQARGLNAANVNVDGWLNLPSVRFDAARPAENFYENGLRLDDLFARLVLPLRETRRARVSMEWVDETATVTRPFTYDFEGVDAIVLEGIFLFKRAYRKHFDLAVWIDCSWETALERALSRGQEKLPPEETVRAYRTIYFPAEEIHFARDEPRASADLIVPNDPHLGMRPAAGA